LLQEGKPVFVVTGHYGMAGELSFYMPEAKASVRKGQTFVYTKTAAHPRNQFYFWPGYGEHRRGQNAIFVEELSRPKLVAGWWWKWLQGEKELYLTAPLALAQPPSELISEFQSVSDLGVWDVQYRGRVFRRVQLFACRDLR